MVSKSTRYTQLNRLELELSESLIPRLEKAASGQNDLVFCVAKLNTVPELKSRSDKETEDLMLLGRQVLTLCEKLGEPSEDAVAERLCWYCRKWGDLADHHRQATQGLAQNFLSHIRLASNSA